MPIDAHLIMCIDKAPDGVTGAYWVFAGLAETGDSCRLFEKVLKHCDFAVHEECISVNFVSLCMVSYCVMCLALPFGSS